jgi:hypothetical protein
LGTSMQILYKNILECIGYEQHTYAIIGTIKKIIKNSLQHLFINNNHWILVRIHTSMPNSHCMIYDSNKPLTRELPNDIIQLLKNLTIVEHLLYKYANVI